MRSAYLVIKGRLHYCEVKKQTSKQLYRTSYKVDNIYITYINMEQHGDGVHPVELSVYSLISTDLDGINQSVTDLRESQAILILKLRHIRESVKREHNMMYEAEDLNTANAKLESLKRRVSKLEKRFKSALNDATTHNNRI